MADRAPWYVSRDLRPESREHVEDASILVVEDDSAVRALVVSVLDGAGYRVTQAASGDQAFALLADRAPDLVISDVQMPGHSGYEVCRRVRQRFGDVPFMFLSGTRTESFDRVAGLEVGADDYLTKPFDPDELLARVRALLRRASRAPSAPVEAVESPLTSRELEVLRLLAEGSPQREIATRLFITPKTVGKHIERLLKKLGAHSRAEAVAHAYREGLIER